MNTHLQWSNRYLIPALVLAVVGATGFAVGANYRPNEPEDTVLSTDPPNPSITQDQGQSQSDLIEEIEATLTAGQSVGTATPPPPITSPKPATSSPPSPARSAVPGLVNINAASVSQLESLPGIGPVKAKAIIDYRQTNGPFIKVEDLLKVKGIGPKTLEAIRPLATI